MEVFVSVLPFLVAWLTLLWPVGDDAVVVSWLVLLGVLLLLVGTAPLFRIPLVCSLVECVKLILC